MKLQGLMSKSGRTPPLAFIATGSGQQMQQQMPGKYKPSQREGKLSTGQTKLDIEQLTLQSRNRKMQQHTIQTTQLQPRNEFGLQCICSGKINWTPSPCLSLHDPLGDHNESFRSHCFTKCHPPLSTAIYSYNICSIPNIYTLKAASLPYFTVSILGTTHAFPTLKRKMELHHPTTNQGNV